MESADRRLWQFKWVRDLALLAIVALIIYAAYTIRHIITPILVGAALAYVLDPVVTWAQRKGVPRWVGAVSLLLLVLLLAAGFVVAAGHLLVDQSKQLLSELPNYVEQMGSQLGVKVDWREILERAQAAATATAGGDTTSPAAVAESAKPLVGVVVQLYTWALAAIFLILNFVSYATVAAIIVGFCFFFFVWRWRPILDWFDQFIPSSSRERTLHILRRMDKSVSAFIRGRLVQAMVMGVILSVGWWTTDVPYWLLLGFGAGLLNLVPFAGVVGLVAAVALSVLDHLVQTDATLTWGVLLLPALVHAVAQGIDGWVVEPLVQGKATELDPLTVLLAVLIGGALLGILGLVIAIPVAACIRILGQELIVPKLREAAASA